MKNFALMLAHENVSEIFLPQFAVPFTLLAAVVQMNDMANF